MINLRQIGSQIVEINIGGDLTHDKWHVYQNLLLDRLDQSKTKLYLLTNFANVSSFVSEFVELDKADYLNHPKLGYNVLLCSSSLMSFQLRISEIHHKKFGCQLWTLCKDYNSALETLKRQRSHDRPKRNKLVQMGETFHQLVFSLVA